MQQRMMCEYPVMARTHEQMMKDSPDTRQMSRQMLGGDVTGMMGSS
jgi:hypothetical protein